jgi:hypothetical protein
LAFVGRQWYNVRYEIVVHLCSQENTRGLQRLDVLGRQPARNGQTESQLIMADTDGCNAVTLAREQGDSQGLITISDVDWR